MSSQNIALKFFWAFHNSSELIHLIFSCTVESVQYTFFWKSSGISLSNFCANSLHLVQACGSKSIKGFSPPALFIHSLALFSETNNCIQFSSVQSLSRVRLFAIPWIAACQASLSITNSWSLLKLMSIELVMPSSHLILCHALLLLSPIPPSIRVFSSESTLRMRWPKYWSFSFSISPSNENPGLISFRMDRLDILADQQLY